MKDFISIQEVAELTGYKLNYLYQLTAEKKIPHYKPGRKVLFIWDEVKQWIMQSKVKTQDEIEREANNYTLRK